jgi:hypothetical protein
MAREYESREYVSEEPQRVPLYEQVAVQGKEQRVLAEQVSELRDELDRIRAILARELGAR